MLKGFEFNKNYRKMADKSVYAQEHQLLSDFLTSEHENIRFEYGNERESKNAYQALKNYIMETKKPLKLCQRKHYVFAIRTIEEEL